MVSDTFVAGSDDGFLFLDILRAGEGYIKQDRDLF
jgi:hypothetical protein